MDVKVLLLLRIGSKLVGEVLGCERLKYLHAESYL